MRARSGCGVALERRPPRRRTVAGELAEALAPATRAVIAAFVAGRGCGLPVANVLAGRGTGRQSARGFACPQCGSAVTAGELGRDDTFRRARRRYGRRGAAGVPADAPPATCLC